MVKPASVDSNNMKKGEWSEEEDNKLRAYVERYGHWNWTLLPKYADLSRCGKSCRLRWLNYLKPGLKRGSFSKEEEDIIIELHAQLGNQWSVIAARLPGRTDNDIKNFCNRRFVKSLKHRPNVENREHLSEDQSHDPSSCETGQNESTSFDNVPPSFDTYPLEFSMAQHDYYPPLPEEEEFFYPEFTYGEVPSAYMSAQQSFYNDPFESKASISGSQNGYNDVPREEVGGVYDPFFEDFGHGMNLWD